VTKASSLPEPAPKIGHRRSQIRANRPQAIRVISGTPLTSDYMVGVAGFEPAASSSRRQVHAWRASAAACLTWPRPSISVHWRPPTSVAIVTHLVTRSLVARRRRRWLDRSSRILATVHGRRSACWLLYLAAVRLRTWTSAPLTSTGLILAYKFNGSIRRLGYNSVLIFPIGIIPTGFPKH